VVYLFCFFSFLIGSACGYGLRALVSYRRRAAARKEREWAKGRIIRMAEKENNPSKTSNVVRLDDNPGPTSRASG
jgi:hypothetical protein